MLKNGRLWTGQGVSKLDKTIFQLASEYNFEAVKEYIAMGNPINICDERGDSLFAEFIDGYVNCGDVVEGEEEQLLHEHDEFDYDFWDGFLSTKLKTPLMERNEGAIARQIEWFLAQGADINYCELSKHGLLNTPLSIAVQDEDYFLAKFLLEHGADPKVWLFSDDRTRLKYENYLIEHMDFVLMEANGERADNALRIAALLARYGLDDFSGICISVDKETKTVSGHSVQWKF
jgi:hypothetical protein